jgi:Ni/Co efflux regulator RcnB
MRKAMFFILVAIFAAAGLMTQAAMAQEQKPAQAAAAAKEARWHGVIVNINEKMSTLDVRRQKTTRTVYYDDSTKWTQGTKTTEMKEFKIGSDVICLGTFDEKGNIHATRIDLRAPKAL